MSPVTGDELHRLRIAVFITFFYREARFRLLFETVRGLQTLQPAVIEITVVTNTDDPGHLGRLSRLLGKLNGDGFSVRTSSHPEVMARPRLLPWVHKPMITAAAVEGSGITHIVYLEEDIQFTSINLRYFLHARPLLASHGLLPGFVRFEYNETEHDIFNADQQGQQVFARYPLVRTSKWDFTSLDVPYAGMFVLDRPMMDEYVGSRSFSVETSESLVEWGEPERAAMGLTWERVPSPYHHRLVVPLIPGSTTPDPACWVYHAANNYTNDYRPGPNFVLGKTRMDEMFSSQPMSVPAKKTRPNWSV